MLSLLLVALALTVYTVQRVLTAGKNVGTIIGKPAALSGSQRHCITDGSCWNAGGWLVTVRRVRGAALLDGLSLLPVALPGIVVGVELILAWNQKLLADYTLQFLGDSPVSVQLLVVA
ncbi:MAG: hypothetical protein ACR5LF_00555 [Symbiopectobacterium sp.]